MIPQLRFPEFTDEWQVKKLGDADLYVADGNYGEMYPKSSEMKDTGIPFIRANNLKNGRLIWQDMKYISPELHQVLKSGHLKTNDILITTRGDIGTTAFVTKDFDNANINAQICLLRSGDKLIPEFVFQTLQTRNSKKQVMSLQTGSALKQLPKGKLALIRFGIPSKPEQEKIADFLTAVDERIAVGEKKLELLETYKRGVMQKIFSQQIRFKNENGKPYPDWEEKKLGEISVIKTGKKDANIAKSDGEYRFYTCSRDYLHTDVYSFEGEAILVAGNADVGLCHYYNGKFEAYQRTYVLQNFKTDGKYLYRYLSHFFRQYALGLMQSSAMTYITLGTLENFTVPLPSEEEQQKIAIFLTTLDDKITAEKSKLTVSRQFKKALLQRMFV